MATLTDIKLLQVSKEEVTTLRTKFAENYKMDLDGSRPMASIKVGHLKQLLLKNPDDPTSDFKYNDDDCVNFFLIAYTGSDAEKVRYVRKIDPDNPDPKPSDLKENITNLPALLIAVSDKCSDIDPEMLTRLVLYDAGRICPPPTGACRG